MKKSLSETFVAAALAVATLLAASPARAQAVACGYQPGLLAWLSGSAVRPAGPCVYQGDYMVQQGPVYDGPAVIAPQPTYSPSPTYAAEYVHGPYAVQRAAPAPVVRRTTVRRVTRTTVRKPVVNVKNQLPPGKGKVQIVRARAEVRIYGSDRMDIRLYRR
jgi:hypothetical protein